jgi:hypothetical protein
MSQRPGDAPTESRRVSVALAGPKFFLLFLFLLASLVLFHYAENSVLGYYGFRVLGSTAIVLCVYVVSFRRSLVVGALFAGSSNLPASRAESGRSFELVFDSQYCAEFSV